jgi:hypothetical protein
MPTTKNKNKKHIHFHLTLRIKNTYVYICCLDFENRQISHFNNALYFINTDYAQPTYFYIFGVRKVLDDRKIWLMFTKNNGAVNKMNN